MLIDHAAGLSELGGVVAGLIRDFLNGVRVRLSHLSIVVSPEDTRGGVLALDAHRFSQSGGEGVPRDRSAQSVDRE